MGIAIDDKGKFKKIIIVVYLELLAGAFRREKYKYLYGILFY